MKRGLKTIAAGIAALAAGMAGLASAETVLSVTQVSYDYENHPVCTAVRMNPAIYGALPSDACTLGTASATYGKDRITVNSYDAAGELVQVTQAYGTSDQRVYATFSYSNNGKVVDSIDANGNRSHNVYDGFDRLVTVYYPSTTRPSAYNPSSQANALATAGAYNSSDYESYGYDANDNRTSWRRRDGQTIGYTYDNLNQETMSDAPGTALDIYTGYDGLGHVLYKRFGSTSGAGVAYTYDGLGRVTSATDMNGRTLWYSYNQASARTRLTYPDSVYIGYGLDNANRVASIGYNMYSDLTAQTYDSLGQLVSIGRNGGSTSYSYDALGRLTSMTNDLSGATYDVTWSFAYNPSSQIYTSSASSTVYDYKETANSTVNQTYDGLNRDASIAAMSGGYDARGNMTSDGARGFTYDVYNRLLTATGGSAALTLTYDPEGRLASYASGSSVTQFLYDGVNLVGEYDGSGNVLRRYIHGAGTDNPLVWFEGSGASDYRPIYTDYHGSVIAYTDASGNLQDLYKYGPYGEPKNASNAESWTGLRFRYTGQLILPEAKLYYYKARVYDPVYGRFLQTDPIGSGDDLDLYAYVGGDPINATDPTGLIGDLRERDQGCTSECSDDPDTTCNATVFCIVGGDDGGGGRVPPASRSPYPSSTRNSPPSTDPNFKLPTDTAGTGDPGGVGGASDILGAIQGNAAIYHDIHTAVLYKDAVDLVNRNYDAEVKDNMFAFTTGGFLITQSVQFNDSRNTMFVTLPSPTLSGIQPTLYKFTGLGKDMTWTTDNISFHNFSKNPPLILRPDPFSLF